MFRGKTFCLAFRRLISLANILYSSWSKRARCSFGRVQGNKDKVWQHFGAVGNCPHLRRKCYRSHGNSSTPHRKHFASTSETLRPFVGNLSTPHRRRFGCASETLLSTLRLLSESLLFECPSHLRAEVVFLPRKGGYGGFEGPSISTCPFFLWSLTLASCICRWPVYTFR